MPTRTDDDVRREIEAEREGLPQAVDSLREGAGVASRKLRKVGLGFVVAGGIGATMRMLFRRGR
jgi:hypothetical protein